MSAPHRHPSYRASNSFRNRLCGLDCSYDFPLFPCAEGTTVKKDEVVETIEALAHVKGLADVDGQGRRAFGHSLRVQEPDGLRLWACPSNKLKQNLVGQRQLSRVRGRCDLLYPEQPCEARADSNPPFIALHLAHIEAGTAASLDHITEGLQSLEAADQLRNVSALFVVVNVRSGVVHRVVGDPSNPAAWQTRCGFHYRGPQPHVCVADSREFPVDCRICLCRFVPRASLP